MAEQNHFKRNFREAKGMYTLNFSQDRKDSSVEILNTLPLLCVVHAVLCVPTWLKFCCCPLFSPKKLLGVRIVLSNKRLMIIDLAQRINDFCISIFK